MRSNTLQSRKVLLITTDSQLQNDILLALSSTGCECLVCHDPDDAMNIQNSHHAEIILLDLGLRPGQGAFICQELLERADHPTEVMLLSYENMTEDIVLGFEYGAADVITGLHLQQRSVLLARIRQAVKRLAAAHAFTSEEFDPNEKVVKWGPIVLFPARFAAYVRNHRLALTKREFLVLSYLANRPHRVATRDDLAQACTHHDQDVSERMIDNLISRLRKKLGDEGTLIDSVRGIGYQLRKD